MKDMKKYPLIIVFFSVLFALSVFDLFSPVKTYSELENRDLAEFPSFNVKGLLNGKYMSGIEKFTEDHFIARDAWISLKSVSEKALGKKENNGVVYGKDGYLFTKTESKDYSQFEKNISAINKFMDRHSDRIVSLLLAPTAPGVMTDRVYKDSPVIDTEYMLNYARDNITNGKFIDVLDVLKSHSDEYIYYKTDHHWTTLGAYYAYEQYMYDTGNKYMTLDSFDFVDVNDFLGTHYSKSKNYDVVPDTLSYVECDAEITVGEETLPIYDKSKLETRDKYAMFLRGNNGLASVKGNGNGKILIIKDSYANCLVPFMVGDYEEIDIIDLRYLTMGLDSYIAEKDFDEILFLYNCETILTDQNIPKANMFN